MKWSLFPPSQRLQICKQPTQFSDSEVSLDQISIHSCSMFRIQNLTRLSRLPINPIFLAERTLLHTQIHPIFHYRIEHFTTVLLYRSENRLGFSSNGFRRLPFRLGIPIPSLRRSIYGGSMGARISNEVETPPPLADHVSERAREICKLVSTCRKSPEIELALGSCGAQVEVSPLLVSEVLRLLNNAGNLALGFFQWAEKQIGFDYTAESYNALIDSIGKTRQFDVAWELVESMRVKGLLTKDTFMIIIRRYAKAKKVLESVETFEEMEFFGLKPDLSDFNRFLNTMSYSGQIKVAHQVFNKMKKRRFSADQKTYAILLEGWGQEQDLTMLEAVYNEMRNEGFEPDPVTYGIIINAYCKARQVDKAMEAFHIMRNPTPRIYCTLINALGSQGKTIAALELFKLSRANFDPPETHIYNAVVRSYCTALRFGDAYWVVDEMRRLGVSPNSRTYDIILHHLLKAQRTKEAHAFFQRIVNGEGECGPSASTYEIVVRMFCNQGKSEKAVEVWDQMMSKGILPNVQMFFMLICCLCRGRKLNEACNYFQDMLDMGIDPPNQLFQTLRDYLLAYGKKDVTFRFSQKLEKIRRARLLG